MEAPYMLVDRPMADELVTLMGHSDFELADGACALLCGAGSSSGTDLTKVLTLLRNTKEDKRLRCYGKVLRRIANYSHLALLERELRMERNEWVRALIRDVIESIQQLRGEGVGYLPQSLKQ
jgi:hypothetical protein